MDLLNEKTFTRKVKEVLEEKNLILTQLLGDKPFTFQEIYDEYMGYAETLRKYAADTSLLLHKDILAGKSLLFEGAQGTLLDVDHGTYPFVTSSSTCSGGACTGSGVSPRRHPRGDRHIEGLRHPGGLRPLPHRAPGRGWRSTAAGRGEFGPPRGARAAAAGSTLRWHATRSG